MRRMTIIIVLSVLLISAVAGRYFGQQAGGGPPGMAEASFVMPTPTISGATATPPGATPANTP
jgi:hypothetical protein